MQLIGSKRLKNGRTVLPAGQYTKPTENQAIMNMETGEIITPSLKDQRIAKMIEDNKKRKKEVLDNPKDKGNTVERPGQEDKPMTAIHTVYKAAQGKLANRKLENLENANSRNIKKIARDMGFALDKFGQKNYQLVDLTQKDAFGDPGRTIAYPATLNSAINVLSRYLKGKPV